MQEVIIASQGQHSLLKHAIGRDWKGKASPVLYASGVALSLVSSAAALALYVLVALIWLVPDRRIERTLAALEGAEPRSERQDE